jgi:serine/threonine-protein kinase
MRPPELSLRDLASRAITLREDDLAVVMSKDPLVGATVAGYHILSPIGRGGMGAVYLADSDLHGRKVAVKVMLPELTGNEEFRQRFIREAQSGLEHPNIVPILDAGDEDGVLFITMEHIEGCDMKTLVMGEGKLTPARCVGILEQAAAALDHAHENGIVHRDVKPQNILVRVGEGSRGLDKVFLTDFGLVKRISSQSSFTTSAYLMGTLHYMAPEQIEGKPLDGRTDVYALGCVLFECMTGSVPFDKESEVAVLWSHMNDEPPSAVAKEPLLPEAVDLVLAKAMAKSPDDRFLTAGEFASAFALEFGGSAGRVRSVWGPGQISASGKRSRPLQRELAARAAAKALPAPPPAAPRTKGFLVGAAAAFALFGIWFGFGDADRREAIGDFVGDVADAAPFVGDDDPVVASDPDDDSAGPNSREGVRREGLFDDETEGLDRLPRNEAPTLAQDDERSEGSLPPSTEQPLPVSEPATPSLPHKILFVSNHRHEIEGGYLALYTMNPDGTGLKLLFNSANSEYDPAWSPDGKQIAFRSGTSIYVMNTNRTGIRIVSPAEGWAKNPTWSPAGNRLAFSYSPTADQTNDQDQGWAIVTVDVSDPRIVRTLTSTSAADHDPAWSPDGNRIAFMSYRNDPDGDIFVMNSDGSGVTELAGGPGAQVQPEWSPSGEKVAFSGQTSEASGTDIYVQEIDSDRVRRVTSLGRAFAPTFSPNGARIAFVGGYTAVDRKYEGLFFMTTRASGGREPERLMKAAYWNYVPDWR